MKIRVIVSGTSYVLAPSWETIEVYTDSDGDFWVKVEEDCGHTCDDCVSQECACYVDCECEGGFGDGDCDCGDECVCPAEDCEDDHWTNLIMSEYISEVRSSYIPRSDFGGFEFIYPRTTFIGSNRDIKELMGR